MNELVSRDEVIKALATASIRITGLRAGKTIISQYAESCRSLFIEAVEQVPIEEDAAYIRHGHWIDIGKTESGANIIKCSCCEIERKGVNKTAYCRDCGAKMDLKF